MGPLAEKSFPCVATLIALQERLLPGWDGFTGMDPDPIRVGIHFHYAADNREVGQMDDIEGRLLVGNLGSGEFLVMCLQCPGRVFWLPIKGWEHMH